MRKFILSIVIFFGFTNAIAVTQSNMDNEIFKIVKNNFDKYKEQEFYSAAELSYYLPHHAIKNFYIGKVSHENKSDDISANTLFQIGSITKSFTATLLLQLEKENNLSLDDTLQKWLPRYEKWEKINLYSLLNMSTGLPNYSDTSKLNFGFTKNSTQVFSNSELIDLVYLRNKFSPPLKSGYFYSNTNYILAEMIFEKAAQNNFADEINSRLIKIADLQNTYYPLPIIADNISSRLASGYNYNQYDNPELVGTDVSTMNLSWAAGAGALLSTSEDIIKWVRALFVEEKILDKTQKKKLQQLISTKTGKPIKQVSKNDMEGFGLGVAQVFDKDNGLFWFYEGETLGYRALYIYKPCNGIIVSAILNSATNEENDHIRFFVKDIYEFLLKKNPQLKCNN